MTILLRRQGPTWRSLNSVWVEPDPELLAEALFACRSAPEDERRKRAQAGWNLISSVFTWKCVAARTRDAVGVVSNLSIDVLRLPKVGWITTWNSRCGIAAYARSLACAFEPERLAVFANRTADLIAKDEPFVQRCWTKGGTTRSTICMNKSAVRTSTP